MSNSLSQKVKEMGAPSVRWVAQMWGVNESTLYRWWSAGGQKSDRLEIIVAGCVKLYGGKDEA